MRRIALGFVGLLMVIMGVSLGLANNQPPKDIPINHIVVGESVPLSYTCEAENQYYGTGSTQAQSYYCWDRNVSFLEALEVAEADRNHRTTRIIIFTYKFDLRAGDLVAQWGEPDRVYYGYYTADFIWLNNKYAYVMYRAHGILDANAPVGFVAYGVDEMQGASAWHGFTNPHPDDTNYLWSDLKARLGLN